MRVYAVMKPCHFEVFGLIPAKFPDGVYAVIPLYKSKRKAQKDHGKDAPIVTMNVVKEKEKLFKDGEE